MEREQNQESLQQVGSQVPNEIEQHETSVNSTQGTEPEVSKNTIIFIVLGVIVVVLALMYLWGSGVKQGMDSNKTPPETQIPLPPDTQTEALRQVSTSDELEVIEADLNATELDSLDANLDQLEQELDTLTQ